MDGAGFADGTVIARFLSLPNTRQHLLLGPWDHGARVNVSPFRDAVEPRFNVQAEVLRFFDHSVMERDTGLQRKPRSIISRWAPKLGALHGAGLSLAM